MARMARLSPGFPTAFLPPTSRALVASQSIRRGRLRRHRRIQPPQRQLVFQIVDLLFRVCELLLGVGGAALRVGQLVAQAIVFSLQLLGVIDASTLAPRHAPNGTPIRSICTAP
jgi:hypothetical protein